MNPPSTHDLLRDRLVSFCGLNIKTMPSLESLRASERSVSFSDLRSNRMVFGAFRYGLLHDSKKAHFDRITDIEKRLKKYRETGNLECLVDIANLCELEFEEGEHPGKHFKATDDLTHSSVV